MAQWTRKYMVYILLFVAFSLIIASYFIPVPADTQNELASRLRMVSTVAMVTLIGGGAILFLNGLSAFTARLQIAYRWFSAGMILLALSLFQWPVLALFDLEESLWVLSGAVILPFIISAVLMYKGMRQFAVLLQVRSWANSWALSICLVVLGAIISGGLAYVYLRTIGPPAVSDDTYMYTTAVAWSAGFVTLSWLLAIKVRSAIGANYKQPMAWLVVALGAISFGAFHELVTSFFISPQDWYLSTGAISWPFIVSGLLCIKASNMFDAEKIAASTSLLADENANVRRSYINSILTVAQLASRPQDITPILESMRSVAEKPPTDTTLSADDRIQLLDTYHQLEEYLTASDPVKVFSKEQLRRLLSLEFRSQVEKLF